jgi:DNA-binding CsgD family transcriptional regulator
MKTNDRPCTDAQDKQKTNLLQKFKPLFTHQSLLYTLIITLAFGFLVSLCLYFIGNIESRQIANDAESALDITEFNIISNLEKLENLHLSISETARLIILERENFDTVSAYIKHITGYLLVDEELKKYINGVYCVFDVFDGQFFDGTGWNPLDGFIPADLPWYKAAVEAHGETAVIEPYFSNGAGENTMSFSRRIFDDEGRPLGVVCLDIPFDMIRELVLNTRFAAGSNAAGGYGLLLNSRFDVLVHPDKELWGKNMKDINSGLVRLADDLKQGRPVLEGRVKNHKNEASVVFGRQIKNGWYLGVVILEKTYFRQMNKIKRALIVLGAILAALFITFYLWFHAPRNELRYSDVLSNLTPRESEIFNLLLTGLSRKQIAGELALSEAGASFHIKNLYRKLGIQSRTELLSKFIK